MTGAGIGHTGKDSGQAVECVAGQQLLALVVGQDVQLGRQGGRLHRKAPSVGDEVVEYRIVRWPDLFVYLSLR
jgi:hypothetical protein